MRTEGRYSTQQIVAGQYTVTMAPRLAASQYAQIRDMLLSGEFARWQIAKACNCSRGAVNRVSNNLRDRRPCAPSNRSNRYRILNRPMLEALKEHLLQFPGLYLDEMAAFLQETFGVRASISTISRALDSIGWSKKVARRVAAERNADLRDWYINYISSFRSYQLVYIDESGCDQRAGYRRTAWAPRGVTPVHHGRCHRGQRYQILPAYSQDGILLAKVFSGVTDSVVFENFIAELLPLCGRWPEPNSVLVMDNASFHRSPRICQMCDDAGVFLVFLSPVLT